MPETQLTRVNEEAHYALQQYRHKTGKTMTKTASDAIKQYIENDLGFVPTEGESEAKTTTKTGEENISSNQIPKEDKEPVPERTQKEPNKSVNFNL